MAVGEGAGDVKGVGQRGVGGRRRAGQGAAQSFDLGGAEMGDVGEGAGLDLAILPVGLAKENGRRGIAVGHGGHVHAYILQHHISTVKH